MRFSQVENIYTHIDTHFEIFEFRKIQCNQLLSPSFQSATIFINTCIIVKYTIEYRLLENRLFKYTHYYDI